MMNKLLIFALVSMGLLSAVVRSEEITIKPAKLVLNAELLVASEAITEGPMVLLLHGTLAHNKMEIIATMQELLADEGINSLAPNLSLGLNHRQGFYDCETDHLHRHENAKIELGYWVNWLKQQGVDRVLIAGHSRGGSQAAAYSIAADEVIKGQFLIAPSDSTQQSRAEGYEQRYMVALADKIAQAKALQAHEWMPERTSFIYCLRGGKVSAGSFLSYYDPQESLNTVDLLQGQTLPTLIVAGTADEVVADLPAQIETADLPQVRFEILEDADHFFRDLYADEVLELMLEHIEEVMP
ncbi:MAG: alpha/beta hydrolase [Gammaproteobacteria bacterium]|nr:alpha/beta hydrolase [Gammaproteobacteria bacterium]